MSPKRLKLLLFVLRALNCLALSVGRPEFTKSVLTESFCLPLIETSTSLNALQSETNVNTIVSATFTIDKKRYR
jgi:hypothetical protein